jgi:hypothetical protein
MTEQDLRDKLKAEVWSQHNAATMEANQQNLNVAQGMTGIGAQIGNPRQTLRERLGSAIRIGEDVKSIARNARELDALLSKHPDIARILDLYEEFRY